MIPRAVFASSRPDRTPEILRSYGEGGVGVHDADVWQAIQATMASHGDFPPVQIGDISLLGPEAGWSNPAVTALNEAQRLFGPEKDICFISIGNGLQPPKPAPDSDPIETRIQQAIIRIRRFLPNLWEIAWGKLPASAHPVRDLATGCENEHRKMLANMQLDNLQHYFELKTSQYFRFNIDDFDLLNARVWNHANKDLAEEWAL